MSEPMKKMQFANIDVSNTLAENSYFPIIQGGETFKIPKAKFIEALQGESITAISNIYIKNGHLYFVMNDESEFDAGVVDSSSTKKYGFCIDRNSSNPKITRLGDARYLIAEPNTGAENNRNDFDSIYLPEQNTVILPIRR